MCQELGDDDMMTQYVEESGKTSLCDTVTGSGCSDREKGYIDKMKGNCINDNKAQYKRLDTMGNNSMKAELKQWISKRKRILTQLIANAESASDEL